MRLLRDNVVIHEGTLKTLKRFKDEVREVREGYECGMAFENYQDIQTGDVIECFEIEEVARGRCDAFGLIGQCRQAAIVASAEIATPRASARHRPTPAPSVGEELRHALVAILQRGRMPRSRRCRTPASP